MCQGGGGGEQREGSVAGMCVEIVRGAPPLAAATDVQRPKTAGATALTTSHGRTPAGAPALSPARVTSMEPLALAAATTTTSLAAQVAVIWP